MIDSSDWIGRVRRVDAPDYWDEVERRVHRGAEAHAPERRSPFLAAVLLMGAVVVVGSVLYALRTLGHGTGVVSPEPGQIVRYRMEGAPQPLAVGEGAAWVDVTTISSRGTGPSMIWRIDASTGDVMPLPETLGAVWVTTGEEGVWATCNALACGGSGVLQLDPASGHVIRTVPLPDRTNQVAVGLGSVWVSTETGVVKIDPETGSVVDTFPGSYNFLGVGGGTLWTTTSHGLAQLDPGSGRRMQAVPFPDPCYLDVTPSVVYVSTCGGATVIHDALEAVDARTGSVLFRNPIDGWGPMRLAGRTLIVAQRDPADQGFLRLVRLDPATGKPVGPPFEIRVDESRFSQLEVSEVNPFFAVGEGSAWVSDFSAGEVIRIGLPLTSSGAPTPSPTGPSPTSSTGG